MLEMILNNIVNDYNLFRDTMRQLDGLITRNKLLEKEEIIKLKQDLYEILKIYNIKIVTPNSLDIIDTVNEYIDMLVLNNYLTKERQKLTKNQKASVNRFLEETKKIAGILKAKEEVADKCQKILKNNSIITKDIIEYIKEYEEITEQLLEEIILYNYNINNKSVEELTIKTEEPKPKVILSNNGNDVEIVTPIELKAKPVKETEDIKKSLEEESINLKSHKEVFDYIENVLKLNLNEKEKANIEKNKTSDLNKFFNEINSEFYRKILDDKDLLKDLLLYSVDVILIDIRNIAQKYNLNIDTILETKEILFDQESDLTNFVSFKDTCRKICGKYEIYKLIMDKILRPSLIKSESDYKKMYELLSIDYETLDYNFYITSIYKISSGVHPNFIRVIESIKVLDKPILIEKVDNLIEAGLNKMIIDDYPQTKNINPSILDKTFMKYILINHKVITEEDLENVDEQLKTFKISTNTVLKEDEEINKIIKETKQSIISKTITATLKNVYVSAIEKAYKNSDNEYYIPINKNVSGKGFVICSRIKFLKLINYKLDNNLTVNSEEIINSLFYNSFITDDELNSAILEINKKIRKYDRTQTKTLK